MNIVGKIGAAVIRYVKDTDLYHAIEGYLSDPPISLPSKWAGEVEELIPEYPRPNFEQWEEDQPDYIANRSHGRVANSYTVWTNSRDFVKENDVYVTNIKLILTEEAFNDIKKVDYTSWGFRVRIYGSYISFKALRPDSIDVSDKTLWKQLYDCMWLLTVDNTMRYDGSNYYLDASLYCDGDAWDIHSALTVEIAVPTGYQELYEGYIPTTVPRAKTATVGQVLRVKSVDDAGKPIEWEAVDMSGGSGSSEEYDLVISCNALATDDGFNPNASFAIDSGSIDNIATALWTEQRFPRVKLYTYGAGQEEYIACRVAGKGFGSSANYTYHFLVVGGYITLRYENGFGWEVIKVMYSTTA